MVRRFNLPKSNDPVKETAFKLIANATGCIDASDPFECVRSAPLDMLGQANKNAIKLEPPYGAPGQAPVVYGPTSVPNDEFLPEPPNTLLHKGKFAKMPFINGAQLDEGTLFVNSSLMNTEQDIINWLGAQFPGLDIGITNVTLLQELLQYYPVSPAAGSPTEPATTLLDKAPSTNVLLASLETFLLMLLAGTTSRLQPSSE